MKLRVQFVLWLIRVLLKDDFMLQARRVPRAERRALWRQNWRNHTYR